MEDNSEVKLMPPIECIVKVDKIGSVNSMYEPRFRWARNQSGGRAIRQFSGMMLSPPAQKMKDDIVTQLNNLHISIDKDSVNLNYPFIISVIFVLNKNILKRDLDNMMKLTQDAIFSKFKLNDSRVFEIRSKKLLFKDSDCEFIKIRVEQSSIPLSEWVLT